MSRTKGTPKTGGRTKGTPNKVAKELKQWVADVLRANRRAFIANLGEVEPKDFCKVYLSLMGYVMPKMVAVSAKEVAESEFNELEALFDRLPDEAVCQIAEKVLEMEAANGCKDNVVK